MDTNANGAIDFNEFIDMMVKRRDCLEDDVAHAFKADLWAMFDESLHLEAATTTLIIHNRKVSNLVAFACCYRLLVSR